MTDTTTDTPAQTMDTAQDEAPTLHPQVAAACRRARGEETIPGDEAPTWVVGAKNSYNARGNGSTMARRVLRDGAWTWLSAPASRGRYLSGDRHDVQSGDVWLGELVAEYTLGGRGTLTPNRWLLPCGMKEDKARMVPCDGTRRRDGQCTVTLPDGSDIVVSDPSWR